MAVQSNTSTLADVMRYWLYLAKTLLRVLTMVKDKYGDPRVQGMIILRVVGSVPCIMFMHVLEGSG